jgi:hypothetical protein
MLFFSKGVAAAPCGWDRFKGLSVESAIIPGNATTNSTGMMRAVDDIDF